MLVCGTVSVASVSLPVAMLPLCIGSFEVTDFKGFTCDSDVFLRPKGTLPILYMCIAKGAILDVWVEPRKPSNVTGRYNCERRPL